MVTRGEMIVALCDFCDEQPHCRLNENSCLLDKFSSDEYCDFRDWTDDKLAIAYDIITKNGDARLDGSHLKLNAEPDEAPTIGVEQDDKPDMVNHPAHYTQGSIECIDALKAATVGKRGIEAVCVANVIKYLWRFEEKNGAEDVRKAKWYIERLLKELEEK